MTTKTLTRDTKSATITVKMTRKVVDKTVNLDGHRISSGREIYEDQVITITSKANGKQHYGHSLSKIDHDNPAYRNVPAAAYGMVNRVYLGKASYETIAQMIAELDAEIGKTDEQIELEAEAQRQQEIAQANIDRMAAEYAERRQHPGWCDKCQSYCYGDCQS